MKGRAVTALLLAILVIGFLIFYIYNHESANPGADEPGTTFTFQDTNSYEFNVKVGSVIMNDTNAPLSAPGINFTIDGTNALTSVKVSEISTNNSPSEPTEPSK